MKNDLPVLAKKLSKVYGFSVRVVGPYACRDGRKRVDVLPVNSASRKHPLCKTVQLARVRLEIKLGRPLRKGEDVDHISHDVTDDSYENVQCLTHAENSAKISKKGRRNQVAACRRSEVRKANSERNKGGAKLFCKILK